MYRGRIQEALVPGKQDRNQTLDQVKEDLKTHLLETWGDQLFAERASQISPAFKELQKKVMRERVLSDGLRLDGRKVDEIR
ncbi:MAG TPA: hypothetical protein VE646_11975, partial [Actinomycetota bacterium]|nr:hypothetical protein [Actinomycetota bacterium]